MALESAHLFDIHFELGAIDTVGRTPFGQRVVGNLGGGSFEGQRLRGRILPSGGDWGLFLPDGTLNVDGRCSFETDDGVLILGWYGGRWVIAPETMAKLSDPDHDVDPGDYYLRIQLLFETATGRYDWINHILAVGVGRKTDTGIAYQVYEIL